MAKNDWLSGDILTRSRMNQPMFLMSGTVAEGGDPANSLRIFVGPGRMRFPFQPNLVYFPGMQSVLLNNAQASTYYTMFVRSDGSLMVSGSNVSTVPQPPRWDAEYLGQVFTNSPMNTGSLFGPWDSAAYEQRGEATAAARPRVVYDRRVPNNSLFTFMGALDSSMVTGSGLSYLSVQNFRMPGVVRLDATVVWTPSGALTAYTNLAPGAHTQYALLCRPAFTIAGPHGGVEVIDSREFVLPQDPDNVSTPGEAFPVFTTLHALDVIGSGSTGYVLFCDPSAYGADLRVNSITFTATLGLAGSDTNEPA